MKTMKNVLVICLVAIVGSVYAQPERGQEGKQHREFKNKAFQGLELSEEQKSQAESMMLTMKKSALPIQNELGENRAKMRTLTTAENADLKAINKLIDSNAGLKADLEKLRAANHQAFRKILTEEQRVKFDSRDMRMGRNQEANRGEKGQRGEKAQRRHRYGQSE